MAAHTAEALLRWTGGGALPVVIDATSCTHGVLRELSDQLEEGPRERFASVRVLDAIDWAADELLPRLTITRRVAAVAVHPTCSAGRLGLQAKLEGLLRELAEQVHVPPSATCCGMAGDRGLLHPELTAAALRDVKRDLEGYELDACVCSNRTCEIALGRETGLSYRSFLLLLEECTRR